MKIVHMSSVHPTFDIRIFEKECRSLAAAGLEVTLVIPHDRDEMVDDVLIKGVPKPRGRIERMTRTALDVYRRARDENADLYHLHDPELLPWGWRLQRGSSSPVIYDSHEYLAMDVADKEWLPFGSGSMIAGLTDRVEKFFARRLAGVITVNEHMASIFRQYNERVTSVANYPRRALAEEIPSVETQSRSAAYIGAMGAIRGYETIVDAMLLVREQFPDAVCRLMGAVDPIGLSEELRMMGEEELRARGVELIKPQPYTAVPRFVASHAVGWLPWKRCSANLLGTPTKLLEYMALGRPVVASDLPFVRRIVEESECGLLVDPNSPKAHADALRYLFSDEVNARAMGERGRRAILERLHWDREASNLIDFYRTLLEVGGGRVGDSANGCVPVSARTLEGK